MTTCILELSKCMCLKSYQKVIGILQGIWDFQIFSSLQQGKPARIFHEARASHLRHDGLQCYAMLMSLQQNPFPLYIMVFSQNFPISLWKISLMMGEISSKNSEGKAQLSLQELVSVPSFQARITWAAGVTHAVMELGVTGETPWHLKTGLTEQSNNKG